MVVTSKVLGLALLSGLSLAIPFDEATPALQARNADAIAEALLEERDALLDERDLFDSELEERDLFDSELHPRDLDIEEHNCIGARDIDEDFGSLLEVRSTIEGIYVIVC